MAANYVEMDKNTEVPRMKARGLQMIREGRQVLRDARLIDFQLRDGDGTQDAHYALNAQEGGFVANGYATPAAAARKSFEELDSLLTKLNNGAGQGDATGAAIDQACAIHGV